MTATGAWDPKAVAPGAARAAEGPRRVSCCWDRSAAPWLGRGGDELGEPGPLKAAAPSGADEQGSWTRGAAPAAPAQPPARVWTRPGARAWPVRTAWGTWGGFGPQLGISSALRRLGSRVHGALEGWAGLEGPSAGCARDWVTPRAGPRLRLAGGFQGGCGVDRKDGGGAGRGSPQGWAVEQRPGSQTGLAGMDSP